MHERDQMKKVCRAFLHSLPEARARLEKLPTKGGRD